MFLKSLEQCVIIQKMTDKNTLLREEYVARINRVMDYIERNMDEDLSLVTLAEIADFSRFHFHRIFRAMVGETLNQFIQRIRVEKAALMLTNNPKFSITDIALDCGFSSSATFARSFREAFEMSPSQWRTNKNSKQIMDSKICKTTSNKWKDSIESSWYISTNTNNIKWRITMNNKNVKENRKINAEVEVKELSDLHVAYVRNVGPYKGNSELFEGLFNKLMTWAGPRNLLKFPETQWLSVYHDNPDVTEEDKLRLSVCITVAVDTEVDGEVGKMVVPGGKFAVARFEIDEDQYEDAWNSVYGAWFPESGFQPDDRLCYELYHKSPKDHPQGKHTFDICIPVKPL